VTDPDSGVGRFHGLSGTDEPASAMRPAWPGFPPGADLVALARLIVAGLGPIFAHRTSVYVPEHLLQDAGPPGPVSGSRLLARCLAFRDTRDKHPATTGTLTPGGVIAFSEHSSAASCVRDREPVISDHLDGATIGQLGPDSRAVLSGYSSFLLVPMTAQDTVAGFAVLSRAPHTLPFSARDAAAAARLTAHGGTSILDALTLLRQRSMTAALQRGLLGTRPAVPAGLEVAGRCLPAAGSMISSDWYEVIPLPRGRTGLVVGDVLGHNPAATTVMAQLRGAAHALADLDLAPAELLGRLNRSAATLQHLTLATCAYAVIDPDAHACTLAGAGHLPPVLALPDGSTRVPEVPAGPSLGLGACAYGQARIKLTPGTILALYTDGLVETRTRPYDQGVLALRTVLGGACGDLETACDTVIRALAGAREDDITMVLARVQPLSICRNSRVLPKAPSERLKEGTGR
jgi:hypothetical protein